MLLLHGCRTLYEILFIIIFEDLFITINTKCLKRRIIKLTSQSHALKSVSGILDVVLAEEVVRQCFYCFCFVGIHDLAFVFGFQLG